MNRESRKSYLILTPTEGRIVELLSQELGGLSVSVLAERLKLARTSVYSALDKLIIKRLVTRKWFVYTLTDSGLQSRPMRSNNPQMSIEMFTKELLGSKKGEVIYSVESEEELKELFKSRKEFLDWQRAAIKKGIVLKGIGTARALDTFRALLDEQIKGIIKKRSGAARFTEQNLRGACSLIVFRDSVVFMSRSKNLFYRIVDHEVAIFTQDILELLYGFLEYKPLVKN